MGKEAERKKKACVCACVFRFFARGEGAGNEGVQRERLARGTEENAGLPSRCR